MKTSCIKVGLVDDHRLFRDGIKTMIESTSDLEVALEASNGKELMQRLDQNPSPEVDVLLLDLEMPDMDGMQTSEVIKERYPHLKFLILTMHQEPRLIQHLMKQGANGYVLKTAKWEEVHHAIVQVFRKDYYFSDLVGLAMLKNLQSPKRNKPQLGNAPKLSKREQEVLELIFQGKTTPEIAEVLFISQRTIEGHRANLLKRLEVHNTAGLIVKALKLEFLSLSDV